jgi:hypothetical protein
MAAPIALLAGTAIAGAAANIYGSQQANKQARAAQAEQKRLIEEQIARLEAIGIPSEEAQKYVLRDPTLAGVLVPESEQDLGQIESQMQEIQGDPRLKQAQMDALASIQARSQGLTPEDLIQIRKTRQDISGQLANQDANIVQNLQQRGMGGSGVELAMRQAGGQRALAQASDDADSLAAMQYNARMQALQQAGAMAGSIGQQEFAQDAQKAAAMDAMSRFNLDNQIGMQQRNVAGRNMAQASNLATKQRLGEIGTANRNQEAIHQAGLAQQTFDNQLRKTGAMGGVAIPYAGMVGDAGATQASNTMKMWGGIADAVSGVGQGVASYNKK